MHWLPAILILPYFIILLRIYRSLLKIRTFEVTDEPSEFVSVIVACLNEEKNLPTLLRSISCQDYPTYLYEVIIVNDNSTDKTYETGSAFKGRDNVFIINSKGRGKKEALRSGISFSSGNLIITTDADCTMGRSWIRTIASCYHKHKPDMIICPVQIESTQGFFGKFQELEFLSLQGITAGSALAEEGTMCNGANLAFRKDSYFNNMENLHFGIGSGDDVFLLHSLKKKEDSKILWLESPDAVVTTASCKTARSYLKQRSRWISKSKAYKDNFSIQLGVVTMTAVLVIISLLSAGIVSSIFLPVVFTLILIKSIPDYLILHNTTVRYKKPGLMNWFVPAQLVYPFYILAVVFNSIISPEKKRY